MTAGPQVKAVALTAALALLLFLVLPGTLYLGNLPDFKTGPAPLARVLLAPALLLVLITLTGLRISRLRNFDRFCAIIAALTLLVWAQSYLLTWDYGLLDGNLLNLQAGPWRGWVDASLWIGGLALAAAFYRRLEKPLVTAAIALVALQAAMVVVGGFMQRDQLALKDQRYADNRLEAMGRFSPERNVLHIVLDSFQADVFNEIVRGPGGPAIQAALPGFTFFEEHLGTFPATHLALPVIISGQIYRNHIPQREFMETAYSSGSILHAARSAGFEVDIAADSWILDQVSKAGVDNAYLTTRLPLAEEAARLIDLALFRVAPHWLKPHVYNHEQWLSQRLFMRSQLTKYPYFTHNAFLAQITRALATDRPTPVYKYFHLMTTHAPFVVNPDCSPVGQVVRRVRETVTAQSRCSLAFVLALLEQMKRAGIYDNTLVVLMGDHGGHVPPYRFPEPGYVDSSEGPMLLRPDLVALATPLLAVKPPGSTAPFRISPALTSMSDVAATIDTVMQFGGKLPGRSVLDPIPDKLERRFFGYWWSRTDPVARYIAHIQEITVTGSAYEIGSWRPGPTLYPPDEP